MSRAPWIAVLVPCLLPWAVQAQMYKCTGADGKSAYQDHECAPSDTRKVIAAAKPLSALAVARKGFETRIRKTSSRR
jgi:hypothetical protein